VNDDGYSDGTAADILKYLVRLIKQFYADPDLAFLLNADPDPTCKI
jgi:hypothetical protein